MTENAHARARELMLEDAMGTMGASDSAWLSRHLGDCEACRKQQAGLNSTITLLRSATVMAPPFLAARTRAGLRSQIAEAASTREKRQMITLALCFDVVWTTLIVSLAVGTAPWFGFTGGMNWLVAGVVAWLWLLPAIGMMILMAVRKNGAAPSLATWREMMVEGDAHD